MKFTVLLSLYHKEKPEYLSECLHSIENNTLQPDQVIIVFDGNVGEILEAVVVNFMVRLPIEIVRIPSNVGLGNALNHGIKFSRNDIIVRMDTDDKCLPERFEKQITYLKNNPQLALLGSAIEEYDETFNRAQGVRFSVIKHCQIKEYAKKRNPFNHMSIVFKKSVVEQVGGYQHHYFMEDYNLWLRIIASGYVTHNSPEVLVHVRAGRGMISRRKGGKYVASEIKLAKLKYQLRIDTAVGVVTIAIIRIVPRLLPTVLLEYFYNLLRK